MFFTRVRLTIVLGPCPLNESPWDWHVEFSRTRVGDLGAGEVEVRQTGQFLQMHESRVGEFGVVDDDLGNLAPFIDRNIGP